MSVLKVRGIRHDAASTDAINLDSSGNVGVGTSSPTTKLHATNSSSSVATGFFHNSSGSGDSPALIVQGGANNDNTVGTFEVRDYNGNTEFYVGGTGNVKFNSGYGSAATAYGCRAWVNFNGTGTPSIRASGNISSITRIGTGLYEANFANAMPDSNFCSVFSASKISGYRYYADGYNYQSTTKVGVHSGTPQIDDVVDVTYIYIAVFR